MTSDPVRVETLVRRINLVRITNGSGTGQFVGEGVLSVVGGTVLLETRYVGVAGCQSVTGTARKSAGTARVLQWRVESGIFAYHGTGRCGPSWQQQSCR